MFDFKLQKIEMLKSNVIDIISEQGNKKEKVSGESLKSFETNDKKTRVEEAAAAQADHCDDHHPTIEISSDDDEEDDEKEEVEGDAKVFEEEGAQEEVVDFWEVRLSSPTTSCCALCPNLQHPKKFPNPIRLNKKITV